MRVAVSGGAGFIGANFVLDWLAGSDEPVVNLDKLTYAGNLQTLASLQGDARHGQATDVVGQVSDGVVGAGRRVGQLVLAYGDDQVGQGKGRGSDDTFANGRGRDNPIASRVGAGDDFVLAAGDAQKLNAIPLTGTPAALTISCASGTDCPLGSSAVCAPGTR